MFSEPRDLRQQGTFATGQICQRTLIAQDKGFRGITLFEQSLISGEFLFGQIDALLIRRDLGADALHLGFDLLFALTQNVVLALVKLKPGGKQKLLVTYGRGDLGVTDSRHEVGGEGHTGLAR